VLFRTIFLFFIIEHRSRQVLHVGVTRSPTDAWLAQQIPDATPFGTGPRYLICDNDDKYGILFERAVHGAGAELIHTPVAAPKASAICERFIGSVRRECLDHILLLSEPHTRQVIKEYCTFFNHSRPHQGIEQRIPEPILPITPSPAPQQCQILSLPVLNGLHHDYRWVA